MGWKKEVASDVVKNGLEEVRVESRPSTGSDFTLVMEEESNRDSLFNKAAS